MSVNVPDNLYSTKADYAYYKAYSSYMLHNNDASSLLIEYIDKYPLHVNVNLAKFLLVIIISGVKTIKNLLIIIMK